MTIKEFFHLYKRLKMEGYCVIVKFKKEIEDLFDEFSENMIAEITNMDKVLELNEEGTDFDNYEITFDEYFYKKYNNQLKKNNQKRKIETNIKFHKDDICLFEVLKDENLELIDEYLSYELDISFTDWLSEEILSLRMLTSLGCGSSRILNN